jgi:hypothetical protein
MIKEKEMGHLLYPISEEIFKEKVNIRFENIYDGFDRFESIMLESMIADISEEKTIDFISKAYQLNGEDNSYVDFYLSRLNKGAKNNLLALLNDEDKEMLKRIINEVSVETIYFKLSSEIIPFITRLSTREVFFCTFYFTKYPCTIWGNYNMQFPVFFDKKDDIEKYKENFEPEKV